MVVIFKIKLGLHIVDNIRKVSGSYALGMSIFSIVMLSAAIFEIPTGVFSDLVGRKKTVVFGALSSVLYVIFYAIGGIYLFLVIGAIFEGRLPKSLFLLV